MGLRRILQKKPRLILRKPPPEQSDADSPPLKNGWLGVAVLGSILVMAALILLNSRLLRTESAQGKQLVTSLVSQGRGAATATGSPMSSACENRSPAGSPQVTFYSELMAPEDKSRIPVDSAPTTAVEGETSPSDRNEEANQGKATTSQSKPPVSRYPNSVPPSIRGDAKYFTVQVGAFSHPGIAQQWAMKWKGRGYNVSLKPVARPTGVIYRLYLGNFSSEGQADELVRHLKSKEGISALRLVVRN